jgi:hypothetical protein
MDTTGGWWKLHNGNMEQNEPHTLILICQRWEQKLCHITLLKRTVRIIFPQLYHVRIDNALPTNKSLLTSTIRIYVTHGICCILAYQYKQIGTVTQTVHTQLFDSHFVISAPSLDKTTLFFATCWQMWTSDVE